MITRRFLVPLLILVGWSALTYTGLASEFFVASPTDTVLSLCRLIVTGEILRDLLYTLARIFAGLIAGSIIGMLAGLAIGISPDVWRYVESTVDFFRSLPAFALFPFFILIFGPGDRAKIATTTWFIAFVMLISTAYAIQATNTTRLNAARSLGASRLKTFLHVILPQGVPQLMVGFRTSLAFAPIVVIATEMFSGTYYGLGNRIYEARLVYKIPEMYAALLVAGFVGYGLNKGFNLVCNRLVHWAGK